MALYLRDVHSGHLQSEISAEKGSFIFCRNGQAWKGELSKDDILSSASDLDQDLDEYIEVATKVFSNNNNQNFGIDLTDQENDSIELSWKKLTRTSVKFSLGSVLLHKCDVCEIDAVLKSASHTILKLRNELKIANSEKTSIEEENKKSASCLEDFAKQKVEMEGQLFTKFVLILNEKKSKIRGLKSELSKAKDEKQALSQSTDIKNHDKIKETEESSIREEPENKKLKSDTKKISHDDSLTGDSEDLVRKIPKREHRQRNVLTAQIPSTKSCQVLKNVELDDIPSTSDENSVIECDDTVDASEMLAGL